MARADLIVDLIKYAVSGNKSMVKKVAEAIIAEERSKQHTILADRLQYEINNSPRDSGVSLSSPLPRIVAGTNPENFIQEIEPKKNLSDLILSDEVRYNCEQFVQEQFRSDLLRSYGVEPRNRILLMGPPGNGKTSLAEAMAATLMVPLYVVKYDAIVGSYLGETAMRLKKLIDYVSTRRCVLFFDEFETLGKERGDTHETGEIKRVVSSLLLQIDQLPSYVTLIGATNHPELLDRAVWRRFQMRMLLPLPTRANISLWIERFQKAHKVYFNYSSETIAKKLLGSCYAEVEEFGYSVLRKYILSLPDNDIRNIVVDELKNRSNIVNKVESQNISE